MQKRNILHINLAYAKKVIDRGYPESIMDALNCNSEKEFDNVLDILDGLIKERTPSEAEKAEAGRDPVSGCIHLWRDVRRGRA